MDDASELILDKETVSRSLRDLPATASDPLRGVHLAPVKCAASSARVATRA